MFLEYYQYTNIDAGDEIFNHLPGLVNLVRFAL